MNNQVINGDYRIINGNNNIVNGVISNAMSNRIIINGREYESNVPIVVRGNKNDDGKSIIFIILIIVFIMMINSYNKYYISNGFVCYFISFIMMMIMTIM